MSELYHGHSPEESLTKSVAIILKNDDGLFNVIVHDPSSDWDDWYVWDCDITEGYSAVYMAIMAGFIIWPPISAKMCKNPDIRKSGILDLPDYSDTLPINAEAFADALVYHERWLS